ncbi:MAG: hypothetical protein E7339_08100 [Clostridiales bacterium]|nr:hypothetical protein [Clostridiales bacterium]
MVITLYCIIFTLSLLLPLGYSLLVRKKQNEPWLFVLYVSVCVVNLGYLLLSLSKTVGFALFANKVAYFGQVFVPLCMFMLISKLSGVVYKKWVKYVLLGVAMVMFALVLTTGHLDWYYKSVELIQEDGASKLVKEYGFLHPVNLVYVLGYLVAILVVIGLSLKRNKGGFNKLACMMFAVVACNIGGWIVEKLVKWNFEFLSASYLMSEFVFFFVYWMLQDYVAKEDIPTPEKTRVIVLDSIPKAEKIERVLSLLPEDKKLTTRQMEMLEGILEGKSYKEIANELNISENTVKWHIGLLYTSLNVSGRDELFMLLK